MPLHRDPADVWRAVESGDLRAMQAALSEGDHGPSGPLKSPRGDARLAAPSESTEPSDAELAASIRDCLKELADLDEKRYQLLFPANRDVSRSATSHRHRRLATVYRWAGWWEDRLADLTWAQATREIEREETRE